MLNIFQMLFKCCSSVSQVFLKCPQMLLQCFSNVFQMFPKCFPNVCPVFPKCFPSVSQVFPKCSHVFPKCFPGVPQVLLKCFSNDFQCVYIILFRMVRLQISACQMCLISKFPDSCIPDSWNSQFLHYVIQEYLFSYFIFFWILQFSVSWISKSLDFELSRYIDSPVPEHRFSGFLDYQISGLPESWI